MLVAALCLAACGNGNSAGASDTPSGLAPDDAVARVLASLGDPMVQGAKVVDDRSDSYCRYPCLRVRVESNAGPQVKEVWLAELVEGAVGESVRTDETTVAQVLAAEMVDRRRTARSTPCCSGRATHR